MTRNTCLQLNRYSVLVVTLSFIKDSSCPSLNDLNKNANERGFCIVRSLGLDSAGMNSNESSNLTRSESSKESDAMGFNSAGTNSNESSNLTRSESSKESDGNGAFNELSWVKFKIFLVPKKSGDYKVSIFYESDDDEESDENEYLDEFDDDEAFDESDDDEESDQNEAFDESDDDGESDKNEGFNDNESESDKNEGFNANESESDKNEGFNDNESESDKNEGFNANESESDKNEGFNDNESESDKNEDFNDNESDKKGGFDESEKEYENEPQQEYEDVFAPYLHLWDGCEKCETAHLKENLLKEMYVCGNCGSHLKMNSSDRIGILVDPTTFDPMDQKLNSIDPIEWDSEEALYADRRWKVRDKKLQKEWDSYDEEVVQKWDSSELKLKKTKDSDEYWDLDLYDFYQKKRDPGEGERALEKKTKEGGSSKFREQILQVYPEVLPNESEEKLLEKLKELPDEFHHELIAKLEELELQRKSQEELLEKSQQDLLEKYHLLVEKSQQDLDLLQKSQQDLLEKYQQDLYLLEKSREEVLEKLEKYRKVLSELSTDEILELSIKSIERVALEGDYRQWVRQKTEKGPENQFLEDEEKKLQFEREQAELEIELSGLGIGFEFSGLGIGFELSEFEFQFSDEWGAEDSPEKEKFQQSMQKYIEEKLCKLSKENLITLFRILKKFPFACAFDGGEEEFEIEITLFTILIKFPFDGGEEEFEIEVFVELGAEDSDSPQKEKLQQSIEEKKYIEEKLRKMSKEDLVTVLRILKKFFERSPKFDRYKSKKNWQDFDLEERLLESWEVVLVKEHLIKREWGEWEVRKKGVFELEIQNWEWEVLKEQELAEVKKVPEEKDGEEEKQEDKTSKDPEGDSCEEQKVTKKNKKGEIGFSKKQKVIDKIFSIIDKTLSKVWKFVDEMVQERARVKSEKRLFDGIVEPEEEEDIEDEPYHDRLARYKKETGLLEAIQTGKGEIYGLPVLFGSMEFGFMGGSMGSVVGEKVARLVECATSAFMPLILVCASGGARMQEGSFSLMQMAKISGTLYYFRQKSNENKKLFYASILASPTTGGVLASFGMLADVVLSEPNTCIAFAGPRVIEAVLNEKVPEGSQEAEPLMEKGMLDGIIERKQLKHCVICLLDFHGLYSFLYGNSHD
uniref:Acetyl-CoA carboxylase carboxyltransferase beta subunit n=1 Tax=Geranium sibiricum TaxID=345237 RepID=A0A7T5BYP7_9ROSI|nr:acetyl-CoA carboxylase carboxyltransferase beta subunit [Geranium sibiricum]QQD90180.1 acetyl-CoA carboxylase carboxyltransferase beta subunit [Geranium sibiricum]